MPTFFECPLKVINGLSTFSVKPPWGMDHTLRVLSSEDVAIRLSANGWNSQSRIGPVCPVQTVMCKKNPLKK